VYSILLLLLLFSNRVSSAVPLDSLSRNKEALIAAHVSTLSVSLIARYQYSATKKIWMTGIIDCPIHSRGGKLGDSGMSLTTGIVIH